MPTTVLWKPLQWVMPSADPLCKPGRMGEEHGQIRCACTEEFFKAVPKGISLVIGCSTFPTWNTVPGLFASLVTGNAVIVKPHPKAILPIAIVIAELQKVFSAHRH